MFLYEAYSQIGVGIATLAYYCGTVIVMALSPILFGEKLTSIKLLEFLTVLCGILLINFEVLQLAGAVLILGGAITAKLIGLRREYGKASVSHSG